MNRPLRAATIERAEDGKKFRLSVSSNKPCRDWQRVGGQYRECNLTLSHEPGAINTEYISEGIALRDEHGGRLVARAMNPYIADGKLVSNEIVWGESERAKEVRSDVEAGVLRDLSIEADFDAADLVENGVDEHGVLNVTAVRWVPVAAAFVPVGADPTSGINREKKTVSPEAKTETKTPEAAESRGQNMAEVTEVKPGRSGAEINEINAIARQFDIPQGVVEGWYNNDTPMSDINREVITKYAANRAKAPVVKDDTLGLSDKEIKKFSMSKAIRHLLGDSVDAGYEMEVSREACKKIGKASRGFYVPSEILGTDRVFDTSDGVGAGLNGKQHRSDLFIGKLLNALVFESLGVQILHNLYQQVSIPKQTGVAAVAWVTEGNAPAESRPTTGNVVLTPHDLACDVKITRSQLIQSEPTADEFVETDIIAGMRHGLQTAFFHGTGSNGQPYGLAALLAAAGREFTVDSAGSPTRAELIAAEGMVLGKGLGNLRWVTSGTAFTNLRGVPVATSGDRYVAEVAGDNGGMVLNRPAFFTDDITAGYGFFGDFSQTYMGMWGGLDILVNPYSGAAAGTIEITAHQDVDFAVRNVEAFAFSDSLVAD